MPRCRHPRSRPSRFVKWWDWCPDCRVFVPHQKRLFTPTTESERVANHIKHDVLHWDD